MTSVCQHIGIIVDDLKVVSAFYQSELGFKLIKDYEAPTEMMRDIFGVESEARIHYLELDHFGVELFKFKDAFLKNLNGQSLGYNHWTIFVEDKFIFCENLRKKDFVVIKIPKPHGFTFFIKDPENNLIEVKSFEEPKTK